MKTKTEVRCRTQWDEEYWMSSNDFYCGVNMPEALTGEEEHKLPPYEKRRGFLVDEYLACPKNWMRSQGKLTSYFIGVQKEKGLWLDFNKNDQKNYHVAIVVSIQGVNPITGLPCVDAQLEQYIETCPKCKITFGPNRYCNSCGYKWPKQNYICSTTTPNGMLWLDGFRTIDGAVRQYLLTEEKIRGVAANIVGKDRVFAIGVSFFLSKNQKQNINININTNFIEKHKFYPSPATLWKPLHNRVSDYFDETKNLNGNAYYDSSTIDYSFKYSETTNCSINETSPLASWLEEELSNNFTRCCTISNNSKSYKNNISDTIPIINKKLEVGAGANIIQKIYDDSETLDYWRKEPEAIICINYCLEDDIEKIISQGKINTDINREGFLKNIQVGN